MQCGARDRRAGKKYGLQMRHGGEDTRSPHLHRYIQKSGPCFFRGKFVRDHPPGAFGSRSQEALLLEAVYFDHQAVDIIIDFFFCRLPMITGLEYLCQVLAQAVVGTYRQARLFEKFQKLLL